MTASRRSDLGLLVIRVALGLVFVAHGLQKMFAFGHAGVAGMLGQLGIPAPEVSAVLIIAAELGGGLALLNGAFTRVAAAVLAFSMLVAIGTVHLSHGFFAPAGVEYPLTLLLASLSLVITGGGAFSLDAVLTRTKTEELPAVTLKRAA